MYRSNFDKSVNQRKTVAVEFKDGMLRLIQFERKGKAYVLRTFYEKQLSSDQFKGNVIIQPAVVGAELKEALSNMQPSPPDTKFAICIIPQKEIFLITQEIPKVGPEEAEQVISNKIGDLLPMSINDVYWDWRIISEGENRMQVQIAATPQDLVDSYMKCLEEAKLTPLLFEPGAEAASRVGETPTQDENLIWIELTDNSALVSIAKNKSIVFATDIPLEVSPSGEVNTGQLLNKIQELIRYTQRRSTEEVNMNSRVRLYGRTEMVTKVLTAIRDEKDSASQFFLSRIQYQQSDSNFKKYIKNLDEYVPLLGAAIRGLPNYEDQMLSLNLVPTHIKEEFVKKELIGLGAWFMFGGVINALILLVIVGFLALNAQRSLQRAELELASSQENAEQQTIAQLRQQISDLNRSARAINTITEQLYNWERIFTSVSSSIPADIELTTYIVQPDREDPSFYQITIEGGFSSRESLLEFSETLQASPYFNNVRLPISSLSSSSQGQFEIFADLVKEELLLVNEPVGEEIDEIE